MQANEGFIEANGLRLHDLVWPGPDSAAAPILLLHATGFLAHLWQPVAEKLATGRSAYAYDSRGHGDSDKPESRYHWQRFVDDLAAFMEKCDLRSIPVAGHSAGAAAAACLAAERPEYISRLVLIEPIIRHGEQLPSREVGDLVSAARRRRMVWGSREELVESYRDRPPFSRWREDVLRLYAKEGTFQREDGQFQLKCPGEIEAQIYENSASLDVWEALPRIACPTLLLRGELTDAYLTAIAEGASQRIPDACLAVIEGAGHLAPMERPDAVADDIAGFLR